MNHRAFVIVGMLVLTGVARVNAAIDDIEASLLEAQYQQALEQSTQLLKEATNTKEKELLRYYQALSLLRLNDFEGARKNFSLLIQDKPAGDIYDKATAGLMESLMLGGFYQDVISEANRYLRKQPKTEYLSLVYYKMARAHLKLMKWQKAKDLLEKVVNDFPDSPEAPLARQLLDEQQYFAVQVGSFEDKNFAFDLTQDLKQKGFYAYMLETSNGQGRKFYRVRVGQLSSLERARELEKQLSQLGLPTLIYP